MNNLKQSNQIEGVMAFSSSLGIPFSFTYMLNKLSALPLNVN